MAAAYFNRAVATFGRLVDADMQEAARGQKDDRAAEMKANMALLRWLGDEFRGGYRTPAATR